MSFCQTHQPGAGTLAMIVTPSMVPLIGAAWLVMDIFGEPMRAWLHPLERSRRRN